MRIKYFTKDQCLRAAEALCEYNASDESLYYHYGGVCYFLKKICGVVGYDSYNLMSKMRKGLGAVERELGYWWPDMSEKSQKERVLFLCFMATGPAEFRRP